MNDHLFGTRGLSLVRRHALGLLAVVVGTAFHVATLTYGQFKLLDFNEGFTNYYDALGESMMDGRFDVPPEAIGNEAFILGGKTYGYFGPTPALPRLLLNALFPHFRGMWGPLMMSVFSFLTLLGAYVLLQQARRAVRGDRVITLGGASRYVDAAFVLCVALGTTLTFMMELSLLYHEATLTGAALAVWAFIAVVAYLERGKNVSLFAAVALALLSFQARSSVGGGPMLAVGLLIAAMVWRALRNAWAKRATSDEHVERLGAELGLPTIPAHQLRRQAITAALVFGLLSSAVLYKNVVTYGSLTGLPSLALHVQFMNNPKRLAITEGKFFQPGNLRTMAYNLLNPAAIRFSHKYPFLFPQHISDVKRFPESKLDWIEGHWSLTGGYPFWCLSAVVGTLLTLFPWLAVSERVTRFRIPLFAAFVAASTVFVSSAITQRYLHDMFPFLLLAGAIGVEGLRHAQRDTLWVRRAMPFVVLLGLFTCYASVSLSSVGWQR
ncbi:MAG TPA: hypothetical protein VFX59_11925 [Polyangiales bacterium]|nr:hypothetical protein [Polyangiales bacterium]